MTIFSFVKILFFHCLSALIVWCSIALIAERLIPGFVLPFLDVLYIAFLVGIGAFIYIFFDQTISMFGLFSSSILLVIGASCLGALVLLHFLPLDLMESALLGAYAIFFGFTIYSFLTHEH